MAPVTETQTGNRARGAIIAGAAALLGAIVAIVVLTGGSGDAEERAAGPPPERCVRAWNADQAALAYGRHNFNFHDYEGALVTYLDDAAREVAAGESGRCGSSREPADA